MALQATNASILEDQTDHRSFKQAMDLSASKIAEKFKALDLAQLEKIETFVKAPWIPPVLVTIFDKEKAIQRAKNLNSWMPAVFMDGSARNNAIGIGIKWAGSLKWPNISTTISKPQRLNSYVAELVALDTAVSHILAPIQRGSLGPPITIFSDCKSALQV